jgi:hypothetical protein
MASWDDNKVDELIGKTLTEIRGSVGSDMMELYVDDGSMYSFYHMQDCCESVEIEDIVGDLSDLIGSPLLMAEEVTNENENPEGVNAPEYQDSFTWTFYKFATIKGYVTVRWYGSSNGYYSESVNFTKKK